MARLLGRFDCKQRNYFYAFTGLASGAGTYFHLISGNSIVAARTLLRSRVTTERIFTNNNMVNTQEHF